MAYGDVPMAKICPDCGTEFSNWVTNCADCNIVLVDADRLPVDDEAADADLDSDDSRDANLDGEGDDDGQVVYELGAYPLAVQARIAEELAQDEIPHTWSGTDLIIDSEYEEQVDALFEQFDGTETAEAAEGSGLSETTYDLDDWSPEDRTALIERLNDSGIPHRIDVDGETTSLVVALRDEPLVEAIMDELDGGDQTGTVDPELLGNLFVAATRLARDANNADGVATLARVEDELDPGLAPFGVNRGSWEQIVDAYDDLADVVADEAGLPDDITEKAKRLRDLLRPFV